jgi:xylan 1,4-beta-xylosidase
MERVRFQDQSLIVKGKGLSLADSSPLTLIVGDRSYEASLTLDISEAAQGGLALFYSERGFCGVGFSAKQMFTYNYGEEHGWMRQNLDTRTVHNKVTNRRNVVTYHYSHDGEHWT